MWTQIVPLHIVLNGSMFKRVNPHRKTAIYTPGVFEKTGALGVNSSRTWMVLLLSDNQDASARFFKQQTYINWLLVVHTGFCLCWQKSKNQHSIINASLVPSELSKSSCSCHIPYANQHVNYIYTVINLKKIQSVDDYFHNLQMRSYLFCACQK